MTPEEIGEIEARWRAASLGPWMRNGKTAAGWCIDNADPNRTGLAFLMMPTAIVLNEADADFIAQAREDLPNLCAEWRRMTAVIHRLEERLGMERGSAMKELLEP